MHVFAVNLLACLVLLLLQSCCLYPQKQVPSEREINQLIVKSHRLATQGGYRLITTSDIKNLLASGRNCLVVDTLPVERYQSLHIPGAVSFWFPRSPAPVEQWNIELMEGKTVQDFIEVLGSDPNRPLIFYCGRSACDRSHSAAAWAVKLGYKEVYRYAGGINAWINRPWDGNQPKASCLSGQNIQAK